MGERCNWRAHLLEASTWCEDMKWKDLRAGPETRRCIGWSRGSEKTCNCGYSLWWDSLKKRKRKEVGGCQNGQAQQITSNKLPPHNDLWANLSPRVQLISEQPVQLVLLHESLAVLATLQDFHTQIVITANERFAWPSFHLAQELLLRAEDHISRFLQPKQGSA